MTKRERLKLETLKRQPRKKGGPVDFLLGLLEKEGRRADEAEDVAHELFHNTPSMMCIEFQKRASALIGRIRERKSAG